MTDTPTPASADVIEGMQEARSDALIASYNPNIRWGKQHVEIVLKQWDYEKTCRVDVGGNCHGIDVIECAVDILYDNIAPAEAHKPASVVLTRADGETLECEDDEEREEDWLKDMIVSARIVGWTPPTLNEVRKINGAKPVPDGDKLWDPS